MSESLLTPCPMKKARILANAGQPTTTSATVTTVLQVLQPPAFPEYQSFKQATGREYPGLRRSWA